LAPSRVTDVKIRSFIVPGQRLEIGVELLSVSGHGASLGVTTRADGRSIATSRVEVTPRSSP
jgi:3-hydroxymyristoyl/3-hydroxydecanoyl-(acyl carrier protein) dehydratase